MKQFFRNNGLSLVLLILFFFTLLVGQSITGYWHYNDQQQEHGQPTTTYSEYLLGNHFLEATMENWESEFNGAHLDSPNSLSGRPASEKA